MDEKYSTCFQNGDGEDREADDEGDCPYREDQDLENAIDFVQKKFQCCGCGATGTGLRTPTSSVQTPTPAWSLVEFRSPAAFTCRTSAEHHVWLWDAAAGGTFSCSGRLHHWLPGENHVVAKNNLLLVASLSGGLLLLEVCMTALAAAQISWIKKVQQQQKRTRREGGQRGRTATGIPLLLTLTTNDQRVDIDVGIMETDSLTVNLQMCLSRESDSAAVAR
ncbi:hypothetical protein INR49_008341 [Caranx melampygus]|nr:hypothetical protein INR49_008341 [Caranx melampygus]